MSTPLTPMNRDELDRCYLRLADGQIAQNYEVLAERGFLYGRLANGVVKGDSFSGRVAMEFLTKTAEGEGRALSEYDIETIRMALAKSYLDALSTQLNGGVAEIARDIESDEAWAFHSRVFNDFGLDADAWTLNTPYTLMEPGARQIYWVASLNGAGDFVKEVFLGVVTDLIVKQAALNLLEPILAERAYDWLARLHNLDTFVIAAEATEQHLNRIPAILLSAMTSHPLTTRKLKEVLESVDQLIEDEISSNQFSFLRKRLLGLNK